ncbi:MAG: thiamine phosphate synthase [Gemmatimonadaceae bacterium]
MPARPVPRIHAVTSDEVLARADFIAVAARVMDALGDRGAVHLRGRLLGGRALHALTARLAAAQDSTGCWLVVNDRVDVALGAGARGAQLTSRSMRVAEARRVAPPERLALGASVHAAADAREAELGGADWCVAGHVFPTVSHPGEPPRGVEFVRELVASVRMPVVAIGGVLPEHVAALRAAGAHGVAVIRGIWGAANPERAAADYLSPYDADAPYGGAGAVG